jgi:hypothetical protein
MTHLPRLASLLLIACIACSPSVSRTEYPADAQHAQGECHAVVKRDPKFPAGAFERRGSVEFGDSGFSNDCAEGRAIATFRAEACNVGADLADVVEEHQPDMSSTCFRGRAVLLRRTASGADLVLVDDPRYAPGKLAVSDSHSNAAIWGAIGAGVAAGLGVGLFFALAHH